MYNDHPCMFCGRPGGFHSPTCVTLRTHTPIVLAEMLEIAALREQLDAAQTALVDAETVKRERDTLRAKIAKLRGLAASAPYNGLDYPKLRVDEVLAILDEVNNA